MTEKTNFEGLTDRQLLARRRRAVARVGRLEATLPGSVVHQGRRCSSAGCRCRRGELHGPYSYLALYAQGRNRTLYVPAALEAVVDEHVAVTTTNEVALGEIAQINIELLRRRALG
jgi:hypothetical protein